MKLKLILYFGLCLLCQPSLAEVPDFGVEVEVIEQPNVEPERPVHRALQLHQRSIPEDLFIYPSDWENGEIFVQRMPFDREMGKRAGVVDFHVEGIRSDTDMDVYIAFSTRPIFDWQYKRGVALDPVSLEIIAGITLPARKIKHFLNPSTSFSSGGFAYVPTNTLVFAINLEDLLNAPQLYGDELYFQAIAVPSGSRDFESDEVQSSEVDFYRIIR